MAMQNIHCVRCGLDAPPPDFVPFPEPIKQTILSKVCHTCWEEWKKMSVMVVNEYRLTPFLPQHREILEQHMKDFLKI